MKVFVTGASGFIGSVTVRELIAARHQVVGLARSDNSAASVASMGAEVLRGDLDDLDSLRRGAAASDGVIHTAYIHGSTDFAKASEADRSAIETIGAVLAGSDRPFVVSAGTPGLVEGRVVTEDDTTEPMIGRFSEVAALLLTAQGVRVSVIRLPRSVHGEGDYHGFVPRLINMARSTGVAGYPGNGSYRWPAVHRLDAARLFRLALESAPAGTRLHAVGDEGIAVRDIAASISRHLNLPVASVPLSEAEARFGFLGRVLTFDCPSSSALTQERFGWHPEQPGLIADLDQGHYFKN
ncbi:MAG: SDR family oxidoreductase [Chloroflexota bacterium]